MSPPSGFIVTNKHTISNWAMRCAVVLSHQFRCLPKCLLPPGLQATTSFYILFSILLTRYFGFGCLVEVQQLPNYYFLYSSHL